MNFALLKARFRRGILRRSGFLARSLHFKSLVARLDGKRVIDVARDAGIGDVIMLTPALRELKRANPQGQLRFYTNFPQLVKGLPYLDEVLPFAERPEDHIFVEYTDVMPSNIHIAQLMGDRLGVKVKNVQPDCIVDDAIIDKYRNAWRGRPHPHVIILRRASRFTPNKDWPDKSWMNLINRISQSGTVIEIGDRPADVAAAPLGSYVDLRGATSISEMAAAIAAADLHVGPVSGPMHIAAAVRTPAVAIIGGYEHPRNTHYAGNIEFFTPLACSPCWLREACPYDLRCLHAITPSQVEAAINATWDRIQQRS